MVTDAMKTDSQRLGNGKKTFNIKQILKKLLGIEERVENIEDGQFTTDIDIKNTAEIKYINFYDGDTKVSRIAGYKNGMIYLEPGLAEDGLKTAKVINQRPYGADAIPEDIATIGTLNAYTPMVRTTGNQDIAGKKTFTETIVRSNSSNVFSYSVYRSDVDYTNISEAKYQDIMGWYDKNNSLLAWLQFQLNTNGTTVLRVNLKNSDGSIKNIILGSGDVI